MKAFGCSSDEVDMAFLADDDFATIFGAVASVRDGVII
jgi:hypothetical protein